MVEIMESREGVVEWSPDMELEGCDAERAAALLLAVAPRHRSFDATQQYQEASGGDAIGNGCSPSNNTNTNANLPFHDKPLGNSGSGDVGGGDISGSIGSNSWEAGSRTAPFNGGVSGNGVDVGLDGGGMGAGAGGGQVRSPVGSNIKREFGGIMNGAAFSASSPHESPYAAGHGGSTRDSASSSPLSSSTRPRSSSNGGGVAGIRLLADLATQELQTMCDDDGRTAANLNHGNHRRSYSSSSIHALGSPSSPPSSRDASTFASGGLDRAGFSSNRHTSPHRSGGGSRGGGIGVSRLSSAAAAATVAPSRTPPNHHHHLRERGPPRTRFDDDEEEDEEMRASRASRSRRNRPRSVSMPEGMELQASRAWSSSSSSGRRNNGGRIDSIKEELEGHDGVHGTRSRTWRADRRGLGGGGGGGGGGGRCSTGERGGSVEDVEVVIGLARQRVGWGVEAEEGYGGAACVGGGAVGEGGDSAICVSLPHMLPKYADMYNKNGRIGIYTRQEREAIISRFKRKRGRRVWKKKIRYNCRKNLADKRLRVKGRFVKMSPEQRAALKLKQKALKSARAAAAAAGATVELDGKGGAASMDMELLAGAEISSETGSGETGSCSRGTAEGFDDGFEDADGVMADGAEDHEDEEEEEEEEEEDEEEEGDDEGAAGAGGGGGGGASSPQEPIKRVRRHSIAY